MSRTIDLSGLTAEQAHEVELLLSAMLNGLVPDDLDCRDGAAVHRLLVDLNVGALYDAHKANHG